MTQIKGLGVDTECYEPPGPPEYAWGTKLCLNEKIVEALKAQSFQVGDIVSVTALAVVQSKDARLEGRGEQKGVDTSLDLQVTDLEVSRAQTSNGRASVLFPSSETNGGAENG